MATTTFSDVNPNSVLAPYIAAIVKAGITIGKSNGTFGYHDPLNRGDFSAMIYRAQNQSEPEPIPDPEQALNPITIKGDDQGNAFEKWSSQNIHSNTNQSCF